MGEITAIEIAYLKGTPNNPHVLAADPMTVGFAAGINALATYSGVTYIKYGTSDTAWRPLTGANASPKITEIWGNAAGGGNVTGTFTFSAYTKLVRIITIPGGRGGGSGAKGATNPYGGAGGFGGSLSEVLLVPAQLPGLTWSYSINPAGTGATGVTADTTNGAVDSTVAQTHVYSDVHSRVLCTAQNYSSCTAATQGGGGAVTAGSVGDKRPTLAGAATAGAGGNAILSYSQYSGGAMGSGGAGGSISAGANWFAGGKGIQGGWSWYDVAGGATQGANGTAGFSQTTWSGTASQGGSGGASSVVGAAGNGGNGGNPGGGGGGGGSALNDGGSAQSGNGGNGGKGLVVLIEFAT